MQTKEEIVNNWLPRYTGAALEEFGEYILLTNFSGYLEIFAEINNCEIKGKDKAMPIATAKGITMINFTMGSANAATIMDLLSAIKPKACLFLGKCGGLKKKTAIGDLVLPIAAIRGEGTSNDYFPAEVPALPAFNLQRAVSTTIISTFSFNIASALLSSKGPAPTAAPTINFCFFTFLISLICFFISRLRCIIPIPPAFAIAIAILLSVTVSIAEVNSGIFNDKFFDN